MNASNYDDIHSGTQTLRGGRGGSGRKKAKSDEDNSGDPRSGGFKIRLFKVYYQISKDRNISTGIGMFLIISVFIQIFDLLISPIMKLPFNGFLYSQISTIFDAMRIYPATILYGTVNSYWILMFKFLILVILYIVWLILIDRSLRNNKGSKKTLHSIVQNMQMMSVSIFWSLQIPIIDFFISIFECNSVTGFHNVDPSLQCWQSKHILYCVLFSIGLVLFVIIALMISLLYNESRPQSTDSLSRLDQNHEVYFTVYRIVLVIVSHQTANAGSYQWVAISLHGIISIYLLKNYQSQLPYYNKGISTVYGACCLAYVWLVANTVILIALSGSGIAYDGQIIVICIGFIFMWHSAKYLREKRVNQVMISKQQEKIRDDLELDQFVTNFHQFMHEQENDEHKSMMFLGFLYVHREECQQPNCPLKTNNQLYQPLNDETSMRDMFPSKDKIMHHHFINSIFLDFQRLRSNTLSAQHHTSYAQFLFYQMGNVHMALTELNLASKSTMSVPIQHSFTIFKYKQLIEEFLIKKFRLGKNGLHQEQSKEHVMAEAQFIDPMLNLVDIQQLQAYAALDVTIVITFENLYTKFERTIEQSATDHIEFWSHLDSNMIDLNVINKLGLQIINRTKYVNDLWAQLTRINPSYPNALYLYGNFLSQIKNDYDQGDEFKEQYFQVKRMKELEDYEDTFDLMFAEDTAVIIMNGSKEQQGKIMKTNQGILKLFGYSMFEVQGHDVNILMPPILAQRHQLFLENFFKTGKERILNNCLESFAMYRTGIIFPVHLVVKPVPSLRNDIQYIGMVKCATKDYEYILTDENGKIDSISEGIVSLFKLPISFFKEHEIPIQLIIPELCEVCRLKNSITGSHEIQTYFDAWNGQKDLKFIIPKNFGNAGGRGGHHFMPATNNVRNMVATELETQAKIAMGVEKNTGPIDKLTPSSQPAFLGMRSPESLKVVCSMFKNAEHKSAPEKYKNNLLIHVNYLSPDFERVLKTDIQIKAYSGGDVRVRVFKIFFNNKKKKQAADGAGKGGNGGRNNSIASDQTSINEGSVAPKTNYDETLMHKHGMSAMQTLNHQEIFQKYLDLIAQVATKGDGNSSRTFDLDKDVKALKGALERQKRIRLQGKILTQDDYEKIETDRMIANLKEIEKRINAKTNKGGPTQKLNNPIAAAFAHKLAAFVRSQSLNEKQQKEKEIERMPTNSRRNNLNPFEENKDPHMSKLAYANQISMTGSNNQILSRLGSKIAESRNDVENSSRGRLRGGKKELMPDFFVKNNFSATVAPYINHNDFVKNLQDQFKSSMNDNPTTPKLEAQASSVTEQIDPAKDEMNADQKSVKVVMEDGGSVATDSKTLVSQLRHLRNALYENYSPQSIQNLKHSATFVMIVLAAMTIASYEISQTKYDQLKENFQSVQSSQIRMQSVTAINIDTRFCILINQGHVNNERYGPGTDYLSKMRNDINTSAINLQNAQANLSETVYDFSPQNMYVINPNNVTLYYNTYAQVGQSQNMNVRTAVMQLAINAYKIKDIALNKYQDQSMPIWFILKNSMNNILAAVTGSTQGILDDTQLLANSNQNVLLILLIVASGGLVASMFIIMPVVTKVHQDKDKLLSLFLLIDSEDVKEQLKRCREFFTTISNDGKGAVQQEEGEKSLDSEEEGKDGEDSDSKDGDSPRKGRKTLKGDKKEGDEKQKEQKNKFTRKNKKLKKYSTNYFVLIVKFFFVISFLESYFLYSYFRSNSFLQTSLSMINEAASITNRNFANFLLYDILVEIIATNGTAQVYNQDETTFIANYLNDFNNQLENFLQIHSGNVGSHDATFNSFFNNLVYQSVCTTINSDFDSLVDSQNCQNYLGGILNKGLYSANLAYWNSIQQIRDSFFKSNRSQDYITSIINGQNLIQLEQLNEIYFQKAYNVLLDMQNDSINVQFTNRGKEIIALFAVYLSLLVLSYFIAWGRFVESMRLSLWVTKSMLAILPIEVIEKVKVIKDFLIATSQAAVRSMKE